MIVTRTVQSLLQSLAGPRWGKWWENVWATHDLTISDRATTGCTREAMRGYVNTVTPARQVDVPEARAVPQGRHGPLRQVVGYIWFPQPTGINSGGFPGVQIILLLRDVERTAQWRVRNFASQLGQEILELLKKRRNWPPLSTSSQMAWWNDTRRRRRQRHEGRFGAPQRLRRELTHIFFGLQSFNSAGYSRATPGTWPTARRFHRQGAVYNQPRGGTVDRLHDIHTSLRPAQSESGQWHNEIPPWRPGQLCGVPGRGLYLAVPVNKDHRRVTWAPAILGRPADGDYPDQRRDQQDIATSEIKDADGTNGQTGAICRDYAGWEHPDRSNIPKFRWHVSSHYVRITSKLSRGKLVLRLTRNKIPENQYCYKIVQKAKKFSESKSLCIWMLAERYQNLLHWNRQNNSFYIRLFKKSAIKIEQLATQ